jgi:hypothetical protein
LPGEVKPSWELMLEQNTKCWPIPDLTDATKYKDTAYNNHGYRIKVKKYVTRSKGRIFEHRYKDKLFGYSIDNDINIPVSYKMLDNDGDGIFETYLDLDEEFIIPLWCK